MSRTARLEKLVEAQFGAIPRLLRVIPHQAGRHGQMPVELVVDRARGQGEKLGGGLRASCIWLA